jgi:hypothetical protein
MLNNNISLTKWFTVLLFSLFLVNIAFIEPLYAFSPKTYENDVFRNVTVSGNGGHYKINGQVSTDYSTYGYSLDEGHIEYIKKWVPIKNNANHEAWIPFEITINIAKQKLPYSGMLNFLLFVNDQDKRPLYIPIEYFHPNESIS